MAHRRAVAVLVLVGALLLAGCTAASPSPSPTLAALTLLRHVPGVVAVEHDGVAVTVTLDTSTSDQQVISASAQSARIGDLAHWPGTIVVSRDPWTLPVYPADARAVAIDVVAALALQKFDRAASLTIVDDKPAVTLTSSRSCAEAFAMLRATGLFDDGGTIALSDNERLEIDYLPARTTVAAVELAMKLAVDYPEASVRLQPSSQLSPLPTLSIGRITPEQVAVIAQRLSSPLLAATDDEGRALPYVLTAVGASGPRVTTGTVGAA